MATLNTTYSSWLILLCFGIGAAYAFLLYQKKEDWSKAIHYVLTGLRFTLVSILSFFLLEPVIKSIFSEEEAPLIPIIIDNSNSIPMSMGEAYSEEVIATAQNLQSELEKNGIRTEITDLRGEDSLVFFEKSSPLESALSNTIQRNELGNLSGVIFLSDGIFNTGMNPGLRNYAVPVHAIGLGDTNIRKDQLIKLVNFNRTGFTGNDHPIRVEINQKGFNGKEAALTLKKNGKEIEKKLVSYNSPLGVQYIDFVGNEKEEGKIKYELLLEVKNEELTPENNSFSFFMDIVKSKKKIGIIAASPHPDIKFLKYAIEKSEKFETELIYEYELSQKSIPEELSVLILHQIPSKKSSRKTIELANNLKIPRLFFIGNSSNIRSFNQVNGVLNINQQLNNADQVTPSINVDFSLFGLPSEKLKYIEYSPPLEVPFGDYETNGNEVLFYQQVGSIQTTKPLFVIKKSLQQYDGVIIGEGWWRTRLFEYLENQNQEGLEEVIYKTVELLSKTNSNKNLVCEPIKNQFFESEIPTFSLKVKNNLGEPVYNQKVKLNIVDEAGKWLDFEFVTQKGKSTYVIKKLKPGLYSYTSSTKINDQVIRDDGQLVIKKLVLEELNLTADHNLLKKISKQSKGTFHSLQDIAELKKYLKENKPASIIHNSEELVDLINYKWLFFLFLGLVSCEWLIRKLHSTY